MPFAISIRVRDKTAADLSWARDLLERTWGGTVIISRGILHDALGLPGLVAERGLGWRKEPPSTVKNCEDPLSELASKAMF